MDVGGRVSGDRQIRDMVISNIGRGPALNALYLRVEKTMDEIAFLRTGPMSIGQGQQLVKIPAEQQKEEYPELFKTQVDFPKEWIVCNDQFGNYLRFVPGGTGVGVWREQHDERGVLIRGNADPPWVTVMKEIMGGPPKPEPEPEPGYAFTRAISISGTPTYCESTVALQAVPASDVQPTDEVADAVAQWMHSLEPEAKRESFDLMWWRLQRPGRTDTDFDGRLEAGPTLLIRQPLQIRSRSSSSGGQPEADLGLLLLTDHWKRIISEGLHVMSQLGVRRVRLGLTVFTRGSFDQARLVDIDFSGLPEPDREVVPTGIIPHLSHQSRPFDVATFPQQDIEDGIRRLLRYFGYRQADGVIAALKARAM